MYDLKLIPIHQQGGKPIPQQSGFLAANPPRRAARSRSEDLLIVAFTSNGGDRLSPELQAAWLEKLVEAFYKTGGSVTSALRTLIETLNLTMLEKNLKSAREGSAITGAINLAAVHHRAVYLAQSGLTHAYTLTPEGLAHFYDASQSDRGLGLSRTPTIRYYQADLGAGGFLFMTDKPAPTWTEDQLSKDGFPNLEQLRRRLLNQASPDLRLDLVQILPGEGQITTIATPVPAVETRADAAPVAEVPAAEEEVLPESEARSDTQQVAPISEAAEPAEPGEAPIPEPVLTEQERPVESEELPSADEAEPAPEPAPGLETEEPEPVPQAETPKKRASQREKKARPDGPSFNEQVDELRKEGLKGLSGFFAWWRKTRGDMGTFFKGLLSRTGLAGEEGLPALSLWSQLLIAILVPLVVVGIGVGVYLSRGRSLQYQYYMEQAELAAASAYAQEDPLAAREGYAQAMLFLDQAESYRRTNEIAQMRADARRALDVLDGAVRLSYHPAIIGALYDEINITRIISYGLDLYLLDAAGGRVIHATRASQGYQVDTAFVCGSGNYSGGAIDLLVDMTALPINNPYQAHVLAADAHGNVVFCGPGRDPVVQSLPRGGGTVGAVTRIASEGSLLYVLDPTAQAVRVYRSTNGQFLDAPTDYFGSENAGERPAMGAIVDLAVNGAELYLLRGDGRIVYCVASGLPGNPVNCENPVDYVDGRPGKEDQPLAMSDSTFTSVFYTAPPDPAVNILDAENADIFRFSLRFRLHQRLRSDFGQYEITSPSATAFTIGVDRIAFIAYGHQVFYAYVE